MEENNREDRIIELLKKQLLTQRVIMGILTAMLVIALTFAGILVPNMIRTMESVNETLKVVDETVLKVNGEVIPMITKLDMGNVNRAVETMEKAVSEFDVEGLNQAIAELSDVVEKLDIEALNTAIDNLNTTIKPLKRFVELFGGKKS